MKDLTTIGLDLAKHVFQAFGADAEGAPLFNRKLRRAEVLRFFERLPPCLVGMEACASAHYWAREISAFGHEVRLLPPQYVKPFVKRGKCDAADAEAIAEAVTRKTMRFVPVKTTKQQAAVMVLKTRALLVRQRTQAINALRAHMGELSIIAPTGIANIKALAPIIRDEKDSRLPPAARFALTEIIDQIEMLATQIDKLEHEIVVQARQDDEMRRLATIPGVGAIIAMAVKAFVPDPAGFKSARHFAAWIGLTPKAHSSGGKERLGRISKMGNPVLRSLLTTGAASVLRHVQYRDRVWPWLKNMLTRRPFKVVAVALANKIARMIWALLTRGGIYRDPTAIEAGPVAA
ncbi:MAG: IS110 family transposase [Mesorhizobium sp.]|uniref:IS110 family transposase n=1 Tax=Mesorhizobium sp. TaxID=1871066 RepID=UPI000FEA6C98|nr:IS110 family transposase [Mesorhizobium sp.]RWI54782.1 MAG: IS110 family transposase [Mesorhizobium sp.]